MLYVDFSLTQCIKAVSLFYTIDYLYFVILFLLITNYNFIDKIPWTVVSSSTKKKIDVSRCLFVNNEKNSFSFKSVNDLSTCRGSERSRRLRFVRGNGVTSTTVSTYHLQCKCVQHTRQTYKHFK